MQIVSNEDNLHKKSKPIIFLGKVTDTIYMSSAELA